MGAVVDLWQRSIVDTGRQPLLLMFVSFIVTFLVVRTVVRAIRAGRGPFRDISAGSVHLHHVVPGVLLLSVGAALAVVEVERTGFHEMAAVLVGLGGALVFDEFALLLYMDDVYWSAEGRASLEAVLVVTVVLTCLLIGLSPVGVDDITSGEVTIRIVAQVHFLGCALGAVVCVLKGKYLTAVVAVFSLPVSLWGAVRLGRPGSWWARRFYREGSRRAVRSQRRAERDDRRWGALRRSVADRLGGSVTQPGPPAS